MLWFRGWAQLFCHHSAARHSDRSHATRSGDGKALLIACGPPEWQLLLWRWQSGKVPAWGMAGRAGEGSVG